MTKSKQVTIILSDEIKNRIATVELTGFIELVAELLAKERIKEITESRVVDLPIYNSNG